MGRLGHPPIPPSLCSQAWSRAVQVWAFLGTLPGCPALAVQAVGNAPFSLNSFPPPSTRIQMISGLAKPGGGGHGLGPEPQFLQVSVCLDEQRAGSLVASPSGATLKKHHTKKIKNKKKRSTTNGVASRNRNVSSPSSEGCKSTVKVSAGILLQVPQLAQW